MEYSISLGAVSLPLGVSLALHALVVAACNVAASSMLDGAPLTPLLPNWGPRPPSVCISNANRHLVCSERLSEDSASQPLAF